MTSTTDATVALPLVGEPINSFEQFDAMPVGTVVAPVNARGDHYTKHDTGWQHGTNARRDHRADGLFTLEGYNAVVSYPTGFRAPTPPPETLRQFQWRFRDHTMQAAEAHGVNTNVVTRALRDMNVPDLPLGVGMKIASNLDRSALPDGSVLIQGDPTQPRSFGMWAKQGGRWVCVLGDARQLPNRTPAVVHNIGGEEVHQDWIDEVGTEESIREVRAFKARAWTVSAKVRDYHSWCSTFESILSVVGVDPGSLNYVVVNGIAVGENVNPGRCASLPVGSILRWRHSEHPTTRVIWFERVEGSTNQAGTRRIFGYRDDDVRQGGYADSMEVMFIPTTEHPEMHLDVDMERAREHIPVGTTVVLGRDTNRYRYVGGGGLAAVRRGAVPPTRAEYTWAQMGAMNNLRVVEFGAPS